MAAQPKKGTTPPTRSDRRRKELALIHVGKDQLSMNEEDYRMMIYQVGGAVSQSASDLDDEGRQAVLLHLKQLGFTPVHRSAKASGMHRPASSERQPQLLKIGALLADGGLPWGYADGIARQMFGVEKVRWLYPDQLQKVITALIYNQKRKKG
jgi:phage gp16-like protein